MNASHQHTRGVWRSLPAAVLAGIVRALPAAGQAVVPGKAEALRMAPGSDLEKAQPLATGIRHFAAIPSPKISRIMADAHPDLAPGAGRALRELVSAGLINGHVTAALLRVSFLPEAAVFDGRTVLRAGSTLLPCLAAAFLPVSRNCCLAAALSC